MTTRRMRLPLVVRHQRSLDRPGGLNKGEFWLIVTFTGAKMRQTSIEGTS